MSWEAYRWTAKSRSELFHVLGPHGVDQLVRQALDACWRDLPDDRRTLADATGAAREVFERNLRVWNRIKKAEPAAFFQDLQPKPADQFLRQAMVTCWMMLPRAGGRKLGDVSRIVAGIFDRNVTAWDEDNGTFTGKPKRPGTRPRAPAAKAPAAKAPAAKAPGAKAPGATRPAAKASAPSIPSKRRAAVKPAVARRGRG